MSDQGTAGKADKPLAGGDPAKTTEERSPQEIRDEIELTREEMGDTVAAVAEKTDVKAQAQARVEEVKEQAKAKVEEAKAAAPKSPQEGIEQAQALARENPKPVAIAAVTVGLFLLWRLLKS